jgi:hypothetical protein
MTEQEALDRANFRRLQQEEKELLAMLVEHATVEDCSAAKCGCLGAPPSVLLKHLFEVNPFLRNKDNGLTADAEWIRSLPKLTGDQLLWHMKVFAKKVPAGHWTRGRARKLLEALGEL